MGAALTTSAGATNPAVAVEVANVRAQYTGATAPALEGVNLTVHLGARVALTGPNGAGKSTLLKAIVGLVPLHAGAVRIHGTTFRSCRRRVAYLPQSTEIDWRFPVSVERLAVTGRYVHLGWMRRPGKDDRRRARECLERLGIEDLAGRQICQLSGGQRQRALLARALVQEADILLLDEPFTAVDAESRGVVLAVLDELREHGSTVILATHELGQLDVDPTNVVRLRDGQIIHDVPERL
jgi:manganese/zinc/iron transport system ATP- binding protein